MKEQSRSPDLAELLRMAIAADRATLHVSLPGRIEAYNSAQQTADVKPLLQRNVVASDGTELAPESLPILHDVPIVFPRGGGAFVSFPLEPGDLVHLVFVERSLDQWLAGGGEETRPLDYRMHSLADAVAYPGCYPRAVALADAHERNLVVGRDGGSAMHVRPDGEIHLGSDGAADYVALAGAVASELTALRNTVDALVSIFNAHVHTAHGTPTATPATPPAAVGGVGATKVKAD